jgi:chemotaxis protein CheD
MNEVAARYLLQPGYLVVTRDDTVITGVVGSGMFLALWDERNRCSGCCHYLYDRTRSKIRATGRYGESAIRHLLGCLDNYRTLRAVLVGGAVSASSRYGERNRMVAHDLLGQLDIPIISEDTGGTFGRKFIYNPVTAEYMVMKVHVLRRQDWYPYR